MTGASGFIGRHAVVSLRAAGHTVVGTGRKPSLDLGIEWIAADFLVEGQPKRIVTIAKPEVVLHLAWTVEHGRFWTDPANLDWVSSTMALARACADAGVSRFCGVGTCFEYAWPSQSDCVETTTALENHLLYDAAKDACRRTLSAFTKQTGCQFAWGRVFHLYGANEHPGRLVSSVCRSLVAAEEAKCSTGVSLRDFMDVRDAGAALAALAASTVEGEVNIASGNAQSIASVAQMLGDLSGRPDLIKIGALPDRDGEPPRITAATGRLRDEVGFKPAVTLEAGLHDALSFWRNAAIGERPPI
ncbi:MAG: NAD(P)-dependent oxidoreductase [Hyphomicrobiaceae bacterium]|nr:NAD(P)-dependent oxidoreductase [Hyphomicrobiaceae bacterium]